MRRSFGPMGGGSGGGAMMKTAHRAVRAAGSGSTHEPFSHSTTNHNNPPTYTPSSSDHDHNKTNSNNLSFSSTHHHHHHHYPSSFINQNDDFVFCTVPSMDEVHHAISSLQQILNPPASSQDSVWDFDWIEPSTSMLNAHCGSESVYDAFRLLRTKPSVKRMVMSLSSDKSVWEAIMNNEAVRELRDSVYEGDEVESSDDPPPVPDVLKWIFINTRAKLMEMVKNTIEMVSMLFQSPRNGKAKDEEGAVIEPFESKVRSSFVLTVMVLLIVVVTRACNY